MLLTIGVSVIPDRLDDFRNMLRHFYRQICETNSYGLVEVLGIYDEKLLTIGAKNQLILKLARGKFLSYMDSDDLPASGYVSDILSGIKSGEDVDCVTFKVCVTNNYQYERTLSMNMDNVNSYTDGPIQNEYVTQHCAMRVDRILDFPWPDTNQGQDIVWGEALKHQHRPFKKQFNIPKSLYWWNFIQKKTYANRLHHETIPLDSTSELDFSIVDGGYYRVLGYKCELPVFEA